MHGAWVEKEARFTEWRVLTEAALQKRVEEHAAMRSRAAGRFAGGLHERDAKLSEAANVAEKRAQKIAQLKAQLLAEREERAEQRSEENVHGIPTRAPPKQAR